MTSTRGRRAGLRGGDEADLSAEEAAELLRIWSAADLLRGQLVSVGSTRYRVLGFDPAGVQPRRLYVEDADTARRYELEIPWRYPGDVSGGDCDP
jgi:hypothetical protein